MSYGGILVIQSWMNKPKRTFCPACSYPITTCICSALVTIHHRVKVWILQDPTEVSHAKNTVRLLQLILNRCKVFVTDEPVPQPSEITATNTVVIYPSEFAVDLEKWSAQANQSDPSQCNTTYIKHIILLDGSWRKTKKIWETHAWLQALPCVSFANAPASQYAIRKAPFAGSMSTLEATAYALWLIETVPMTPFYEALAALQEHWYRHKPM